MALSDPQSITVDGVTYSLPRITSGNNSSTYASSDGTTRLTASHSYGKRIRRVLRLDLDQLIGDNLNPALNIKTSMSNYIVFDIPTYGWTHDQQLEAWRGLKTLAAGTSDSIVNKLLGGEN